MVGSVSTTPSSRATRNSIRTAHRRRCITVGDGGWPSVVPEQTNRWTNSPVHLLEIADPAATVDEVSEPLHEIDQPLEALL